MYQSLINITFDKNMKLLNMESIPIKERIRDILYLGDLNQLVLALESFSSIGFFSEVQ